jgi:hypothetical protein
VSAKTTRDVANSLTARWHESSKWWVDRASLHPVNFFSLGNRWHKTRDSSSILSAARLPLACASPARGVASPSYNGFALVEDDKASD